jgi:hypothetical protein
MTLRTIAIGEVVPKQFTTGSFGYALYAEILQSYDVQANETPVCYHEGETGKSLLGKGPPHRPIPLC